MILIDYCSIVFLNILFLPFLSYLIRRKRRFYFYALYGLIIDLSLLNKYLNVTIILLLYYVFFSKKRKHKLFKFILIYNLIFIPNLILNHNAYFLISSYYILSFILNLLFFIYSNKYKLI